MSIRLPLQVIVSSTNNDEVGAGSVGGGVIIGPFQIPQDTDNVVVKLTASTVGGAVSAQFQTTDDGGITWYGIARTSVVSNAAGDNVQWMSIPTIGQSINSASIVAVGSVFAGTGIGSAQPSLLASNEINGLPLLSPTARIIIQITGSLTSSSILTQVKVNNQSAHS